MRLSEKRVYVRPATGRKRSWIACNRGEQTLVSARGAGWLGPAAREPGRGGGERAGRRFGSIRAGCRGVGTALHAMSAMGGKRTLPSWREARCRCYGGGAARGGANDEIAIATFCRSAAAARVPGR